MRIAAVALLVVLAAAAAWVKWGVREAQPPAPPRPPPIPAERWAKAPLPNLPLDIWLPLSWTDDAQQVGERGWIFRGPADDGDFRPNFHVYRFAERRDTEAFFRFWRDKYSDPSGRFWKILDEGHATVAGTPARFLVYEQREPGTGAEPVRCVTIDWVFVRDGYAVVLRGAATARGFGPRYRPLFNEIARRVRYRD